MLVCQRVMAQDDSEVHGTEDAISMACDQVWFSCLGSQASDGVDVTQNVPASIPAAHSSEMNALNILRTELLRKRRWVATLKSMSVSSSIDPVPSLRLDTEHFDENLQRPARRTQKPVERTFGCVLGTRQCRLGLSERVLCECPVQMRSRFRHQWRQRYAVLTPQRLYVFLDANDVGAESQECVALRTVCKMRRQDKVLKLVTSAFRCIHLEFPDASRAERFVELAKNARRVPNLPVD